MDLNTLRESLPKMSTNTAALPSSTTTAPVASLTSPSPLADQGQSRLMAIPKELRNKIYEYVFCDNSTYASEPIMFHWNVGAEIAEVPRLVRLNNTKPPSKDSILPCRQLYTEMKQMHATAYRAYWTENRFVYADNANMLLPADKDMRHIREFRILLHGEYHLRIFFKDHTWHSALLFAGGRVLSIHAMGPWFFTQGILHGALTTYMSTVASTWREVDPSVGQGLIRDMVVAISRLEDIDEEIQCLDDFMSTIDDGEDDDDDDWLV